MVNTSDKEILGFMSKQYIYGDMLNSISTYTSNKFMIENDKTAHISHDINELLMKYEATPDEGISAIYQALVGMIVSKTATDVINLAQSIIKEHQKQ